MKVNILNNLISRREEGKVVSASVQSKYIQISERKINVNKLVKEVMQILSENVK